MGGVSQTLSSPPFVCHWAAKSANQLCPWICIHQKVISKARTALKGSLCPRLKVIYAHFSADKESTREPHEICWCGRQNKLLCCTTNWILSIRQSYYGQRTFIGVQLWKQKRLRRKLFNNHCKNCNLLKTLLWNTLGNSLRCLWSNLEGGEDKQIQTEEGLLLLRPPFSLLCGSS